MKKINIISIVAGIAVAASLLIISAIETDYKRVGLYSFIASSSIQLGVTFWGLYYLFSEINNYRFTIRKSVRVGLRIAGIIGVIAGIGAVLNFQLFGAELPQLEEAKYLNDTEHSPEEIEAAITKSRFLLSWYMIALKQLLFVMVVGIFYTFIVAALLSFHPSRIREAKQ